MVEEALAMASTPPSFVPRVPPETPETLRRRALVATFVAFLIVGLSVVMSYDWANGGFLVSAPFTILSGILVAAFIYIAARYARRGPSYFFPAMTCPYCRRIVPADSNLCPYCGQRLR